MHRLALLVGLLAAALALVLLIVAECAHRARRRATGPLRSSSPADAVFLAGAASCRSWCEHDVQKPGRLARHCRGDMDGACGGCSYCGSHDGCYGELSGLAVGEGRDVHGGGSLVRTQSAGKCKAVCSASAHCQSISFCPQWNGCWMKDAKFAGSEPTRSHGRCKTLYKTSCPGDGGDGGNLRVVAPPSGGGGGETVKVMTYNTEYKNYGARVRGYGAKIKEAAPAVVGTQECQDKHKLAQASGLSVVPGTDFQNPIFYDPQKVQLQHGSSGWMRIKRDNYAKRTMTWATFTAGSSEFVFVNTHLPHNHGEAASAWTHHHIAHGIAEKLKQLGAGHKPVVIVGDTNPHASSGATSFEETLRSKGYFTAYTGRGSKGGLSGYDKIFATADDFTATNGQDHGTGGSDHPAVTVDLVFKR